MILYIGLIVSAESTVIVDLPFKNIPKRTFFTSVLKIPAFSTLMLPEGLFLSMTNILGVSEVLSIDTALLPALSV